MEIAAGLHKILIKSEIAKGIYDLWVEYPEAAKAKPGQFVSIRCGAHLLRRPISICEIDGENGRLRLVFEVRGEGTKELAECEAGDSIDILAPLGNGFNLGNNARRAVFVGGGIGVPPLLEAARHFGKNADAILGFRSAGAMILKSDFEKYCGSVAIATEDGSAGEKGFVTPAFCRRLDSPCDVVFACGPRAMLRMVAQEAIKRSIPCFVSMEEHMACGVGACLSCACKGIYEGKEQYLHVCKHGPVFDAKRIVW